MQRTTISVLIVDDSAVMRQLLSVLLSRRPGFSIETAADPIIASSKMRKSRPDVIILDLQMSRMDGLTFLSKIMAEDPIPVVICAALSEPGTKQAVIALERGAVAVIPKPQVGIGEFLEKNIDNFANTVIAAAESMPRLLKSPVTERRVEAAQSLQRCTDKVIAIGASTGGTEAIRQVLETLPLSTPGIVIVQHMPAGFTAAFANRLNEICSIEIKEAATGDRITPGKALVAPGNKHMLVHKRSGCYVTEISNAPPVSRHRPSVNVLFSSVARAVGKMAIGVILTGMGDDGAKGMVELARAGAMTIAQDESTSVVFGMPKAAIELGGVKHVLPLGRIAGALISTANSI